MLSPSFADFIVSTIICIYAFAYCFCCRTFYYVSDNWSAQSRLARILNLWIITECLLALALAIELFVPSCAGVNLSCHILFVSCSILSCAC